MNVEFKSRVSLGPYTTLRAGGPADRFLVARSVDQLAGAVSTIHQAGAPLTVLGSGSNVLPSDAGVAGYTVVNLTGTIAIQAGVVTADCGVPIQEVFLKCTQSGLTGFEFAVGIPGTLGGALVSNAGAYRNNVSTHLRRLDVVMDGKRQWIQPSVMAFSYRDSVLRSASPPPLVLLRAEFELKERDQKRSYDEAREFQRQRISKQPPQASAGSFFKNVNDKALAASLPRLSPALREAGVVPAGHLIEEAGLRGFRLERAMLANRHANFIVNLGGATATNIRTLAEHAKRTVSDRFGVTLEEEVLYIGDWSGFKA